MPKFTNNYAVPLVFIFALLSGCVTHHVTEYRTTDPDKTIDGVPLQTIWRDPELNLFASVSAMPLVSTVYDYSEHHKKLSKNKYYVALVIGGDSEDKNIRVSLSHAKIILDSGLVIGMDSIIKEVWFDFSKRKKRLIYLTKKGVSEHFSEASPLIKRKGRRVTVAKEYYSDEYGFTLPEGTQGLKLNLSLRIEVDGVEDSVTLILPMTLIKKVNARKMFR
ncbi:MAG: hypothetical protein V3U84_06225 [Thiotrichaceae bacterium]